MPALLELQRAFAASMLHEEDDAVCGAVVDDGFAAAERLRIYRNTCRSTLIEALRMTYPAVERLVGRDFFDMAAARCASSCIAGPTVSRPSASSGAPMSSCRVCARARYWAGCSSRRLRTRRCFSPRSSAGAASLHVIPEGNYCPARGGAVFNARYPAALRRGVDLLELRAGEAHQLAAHDRAFRRGIPRAAAPARDCGHNGAVDRARLPHSPGA